MDFLYWHASQDNYFELECEFIDFIFETPELSEIIRRIISKGKIPRARLEEMFGVYVIMQSKDTDGAPLVLPNFYDEEIEKELNLLKSVKRNFEDDLESHTTGRNPFNAEQIKESIKKSCNSKNLIAFKKLYLDIIQEIDLLDTEIYTKRNSKFTKGFAFNKETGVLIFAGKDIALAKRNEITDAVLLMRSLVDADGDEWLERGEILITWGLSKEDRDIATRNKIFNAGKVVNQFIKNDTGIDDFLEFSTLKARINPKYR